MNAKYYKDRAIAGKWLLDRADKADWWTWVVLTAHNPDPTNPQLNEIAARRVFEDLERQGLIEPSIFALPSGQKIAAYCLNLSDRTKWDTLITVPGRIYMAAGWLWSRLNEPFVVAVVSGIFAAMGAFIGAVAGAWFTKQ